MAATVTVGIPTFNRASWLKETIESVLSQTFTDFRLLVSDNASVDDTPAVVRSFGDERIDYVRSERNVGPIGNLNRLIGLADTEFLVLLPDDDLLYPGHLEAAVDLLQRHETVGLVHSAFDMIDERSHVIRGMNPVATRSPVTVAGRDRALEHMMVSNWPICFSAVAYRTKAIVAAGGLREQEEPFSDLQMWMRIALEWDFGYLSDTLAGFRVHPEQVSMGLGAQHGVTSPGPDLALLHAKIRFRRRKEFLAGAPLDPRDTDWLGGLATLELLIERASAGLPRTTVAARLGNLVSAHPRIVLRNEFWRLVVTQLGGSRILSARRRAGRAYRRLTGNARRCRPASG